MFSKNKKKEKMLEFDFIRKKKRFDPNLFLFSSFNIEICSCSCMSRSFDFVDKLIAIVVENSSPFFFFFFSLPLVNRSIYSRIILHIWIKLSFGVTLLQQHHLAFFFFSLVYIRCNN